MKYNISILFIFITSITTFPLLNAMKDDPQALLGYAIFSGSVIRVRECLANGAKVDERIDNNYNNSRPYLPLTLAARLARPEIVEALISAGAQVNIQDERGKTPLHYVAAWYAHPTRLQPEWTLATMETLIKTQARVNAVDNKGQTPLMKAIGSEYGLARAKALLNAGASTLPQRFKDQKNALDLAIRSHGHLVDQLQQNSSLNLKDLINNRIQIITLLAQYRGMEIALYNDAQIEHNSAQQIESSREGSFTAQHRLLETKKRRSERIKDSSAGKKAATEQKVAKAP